jgi:mono/diheme cytochrome c family protein/DNA-binding beta-propeller fold protein YncE
VVTRYSPCSCFLAAIFSWVSTAAAFPVSADTPHYYTEFDPGLSPWRAPEEKNYEEVFKNYEFFAIVRSEDGADLSVSHYLKGAVADVSRWHLQPDGSLLALGEGSQGADSSVPVGERLYQQHCANCHGADRLGIAGPALLPENLERLRKTEAVQVIRDGRPATQMPPFGTQLDAEAITALADFIFTPPAAKPSWDSESIRASHELLHAPGSLPDKPKFSADPLNLFMVVEAGDHHVTVLDGDSLEPVHRFASRYALHGGLKYSPDGRFVYLASRDGWITKFDIYNLTVVAEIRVGINTRNVAVSGDGRTVLAGNYLPETLVLLDAADLSLLRVIPVADSEGKPSRVSAVYQAEPRASFVAALKDVPEVWEIGYDKPDFPIRKIRLQRVLDDFFFNQDYTLLIGADRAKNGGQVIDLDSGRQVAELPLDGMPHLGSGIIWDYQGHPVMATPNLKQGLVTVIDMDSWKVIRQIETLGPGFFMRSHENTPYAWTDVFFGPNRDVMHVFDKRTLEMVKTLRPEPGKTSAHVEFTRDGRYALVSLWEMDGALIVYDAATLEEVKRVPMCKPSGKYNVYNKINRSAGTSH